MEIGAKIKRLRKLCGLTQEELANRCELTKGYISQLENEITSPTIQTLNDILVALGTNLADFFKDTEEEKIVWTKDDYFVNDEVNKSMTWLVPNAQKNEMEPVLVTIYPNTSTTIDMPHEGQEFGYVLEGCIKLHLGSKEYKCKAGESFYFTTDKNHYIENVENKISKVIWISSPPNF